MTAERSPSSLPPELEWGDADLKGSVTDRFLRVAETRADATALVGPDGSVLTFADLRAAALGMAEAIVARIGDGPGRVATFVDTNPSTIATILGILAAGKAYIPIGPGEPEARAAAKLEHAETPLLIAPSSLADRAGELIGADRVLIREAAAPSNAMTAPAASGPDDYLNLVYTSGSTGLPKGVLQLQGNVLYETASGAHDMATSPDDRFGLVMPLTFGAAISDFLGSLLNGAALHMFDLRGRGSAAMADWMLDQRITATHMVPTVFRRWMAEVPSDRRYPDMRAIKLGGESVFPTDVTSFNRHFTPGCVLRNGLGTTETYLITSFFVNHGDTFADGIVPVGYPVSGKSVAVVDDRGKPVPDGEIGEIVVCSDYLSPGYWKDEETTSRKYGVDPGSGKRTYRPGDLGRIRPDGGLEHLGRSDDLVKINGNRVEVGEVEAALLQFDGIAEAAVAAQPFGDGTLRLVGYVVSSAGPVNQATIRTSLAERMPPHMVPSLLVEMDSLPVLPFGKVDKRSLPLPDGSRPELGVPYREPSTEEERVIAAHAAEVLRFDRVGVDDDLFALGIDSLLATRLVGMTGRSLGVNLTVEALFDHPTVAGLAKEALAAADQGQDEMDLASLVAELEESDRSSQG